MKRTHWLPRQCTMFCLRWRGRSMELSSVCAPAGIFFISVPELQEDSACWTRLNGRRPSAWRPLWLRPLSRVARQLGYVTGNRMTSVQTRNVKLRARAVRILMSEAGLNEASATKLLDEVGGDLRVALVMSKSGCSRTAAENALQQSSWVVSRAIAAL